MIGLVLVALGTGGIKPCVSAFGGDQFVVPDQDLQLQQFFSVFYFSVNAGSFVSTFITPILREDVHCFGEESCFSLAFGVPAILMVISISKSDCSFEADSPLGDLKGCVTVCPTHCCSVCVCEREDPDSANGYTYVISVRSFLEEADYMFSLYVYQFSRGFTTLSRVLILVWE